MLGHQVDDAGQGEERQHCRVAQFCLHRITKCFLALLSLHVGVSHWPKHHVCHQKEDSHCSDSITMSENSCTVVQGGPRKGTTIPPIFTRDF